MTRPPRFAASPRDSAFRCERRAFHARHTTYYTPPLNLATFLLCPPPVPCTLMVGAVRENRPTPLLPAAGTCNTSRTTYQADSLTPSGVEDSDRDKYSFGVTNGLGRSSVDAQLYE